MEMHFSFFQFFRSICYRYVICFEQMFSNIAVRVGVFVSVNKREGFSKQS